ncbi:MAG: potassium-transporting ATPase subunit KdpC [Hyphomicrobiales bacterium]
MFAHLRPALVIFALLTLLTGVAYPFAMTGIAQALFPRLATGSMIPKGDGYVGSELIGQANASERYFHPRPSAAGAGYDAAASSGSNLGPTSAKLMERIKADSDAVKAANGVSQLPADAVTASGSGLDPEISPAYALLQVGRVAKARNLPEDELRRVVEEHIERPFLGLIGEPRVNVLLLNLAIDKLG